MRCWPVVLPSCVALAGCDPLSPHAGTVGTPLRPSFQLSSSIASGYVAVDLGSLGTPYSEALAINNVGQVVAVGLPGRELSVFLWAHGEQTVLGEMGDCVDHHDLINDAGEVVCAGSRWASGVTTALGMWAQAINEPGQIVGTAPTGHAALWDHGVITDLGTLGGSFSSPFALNDAGRVVGWSAIATGEYHAFLWANDVMTDLGTLGGNWSEPGAINAAGQVVGRSVTRFVTFPENFDFRAVLWRPMTTPEWIEALAGQVKDLLAAGILTQDQADGLLNKLQQVRAKLDAEQREAAGQQTEAFVHQVEGFVTASVLTAEQAQPLIGAARGIIDRLQAPSS